MVWLGLYTKPVRPGYTFKGSVPIIVQIEKFSFIKRQERFRTLREYICFKSEFVCYERLLVPK